MAGRGIVIGTKVDVGHGVTRSNGAGAKKRFHREKLRNENNLLQWRGRIRVRGVSHDNDEETQTQ
jgi:hypothetical protein